MDDELSFGRWVKVRRVALGLTQANLAERVAYSIATIRKIESDDLQPSQQITERLADVLALSPTERSDFIRRARNRVGGEHRRYPPTVQATPHPSHLPRTASLPPFLTEQAASSSPPAPFVGRTGELDALLTALETARTGKGQLLFVIGDAGRGKTVLVQEFAHRAQQEDAALLVAGGHCNAHTGIGDPYLPFREVLLTLVSDVEAKWSSSSLSTESARRLWQAMPTTLSALIEQAPDLIGPFIPVKTLQSHAAHFAHMDARWVQQLAKVTADKKPAQLDEKRLFAQVTAVLKAIAAQFPLLLILEDLHWIDIASSSLVFHLSREIGDRPILLVGTYRPDELVGPRRKGQGEERHPLLHITKELKRQHGDIWLDLGDQSAMEGREFVDAYLDTQPNHLGEAFRSAFFHHTRGHALFTVELLREMQARGDLHTDEEGFWIEGSTIDWRTLPPKVEGVIEKRIEGLDEELKGILTVASIEGESFTAELVARVQQGQDREMVQRLSNELDRQHHLVMAEALGYVGRQRLSRYRFRHYLFQHYLYHRLDVTERAYLHEAAGNALESLYGEQTEQVAAQLAYHYDQAGVNDKAVTYLIQAGEQAQLLSANHEAVQHLTRGVALVTALPATPQRVRQELTLHIALGRALAAIKGYAAPETGEAYRRARELALPIEETPQIFAALHGLYSYHDARGESQSAYAEAEQLLHLAQVQPDPVLRPSAHRALGTTLWYLGELSPAREQFEQGVLFCHPQNHLSHVLLSGQDEGVSCRAKLAIVLCMLGYPEQAVQQGHEALALAQALAHPMSLSMAIADLTVVHLLLQEGQVAQSYAEALITLAAEQDFAFRLAFGTYCRGLALVSQGKEEGIDQMQLGLNRVRSTGSEQITSYLLAGLAKGYAQAGDTEQGISMLAEALAITDKTGNRFWDAEIYRLKGEMLLTLAQGTESTPPAQYAEAEACFRQAIAIARQQQAKSFELRATTSLCRLWRAHGKKEKAHALLADIYGWFTEGFDTVELIEAKTLLEALR